MKTQLPTEIKTIEAAQKFLTDLYKNQEVFHPEDDANDIAEIDATPEERTQLNKLMADIYELTGELIDGEYTDFDPCGFILNLDPEYRAQTNLH